MEYFQTGVFEVTPESTPQCDRETLKGSLGGQSWGGAAHGRSYLGVFFLPYWCLLCRLMPFAPPGISQGPFPLRLPSV